MNNYLERSTVTRTILYRLVDLVTNLQYDDKSEGYYREETGWNPEKLIEVETAVDSDQELK